MLPQQPGRRARPADHHWHHYTDEDAAQAAQMKEARAAAEKDAQAQRVENTNEKT